MEEATFISRSGSFVRNSASLKIAIIVVLSLLLLIPISMVHSLIQERGNRQNQVVAEISDKWGAAQAIAGPVLTIPYKKHFYEPDKTPVTVTRYIHFLPDSLQVKGSLEPKVLYRGVYEALLYSSDLQISGKFSFPDLERLSIPIENVIWEKAFFQIGISDMGGIREQISGTVAENDVVFEPGTATDDLFSSGVSAAALLKDGKESMVYTLHLGINGNRDLYFLPLGKETKVSLTSNWPSPSFTGQFLPDERRVNKESFSANWNILHLNRNYPQSWEGTRKDLNNSAFGVSLHAGADIYQKTTRTAKYGIMFVVFTFTSFFLAEVINTTRIHPIQYLLVGSAVILFYVLLVALSEHLGFNGSFLLSAMSVIVTISGYTSSILSRKMAMVLFVILTILYSYLFITLQLEDYALLVGSVGLFGTLGAVMYLTRGIDWYSLQAHAAEVGTQTLKQGVSKNVSG